MMEPGLRTHKSASLRVAVAQGLPVDMWEGTREVVSLRSGAPRKGHATRLMHKVCLEADRVGIVLVLQPIPYENGWGKRDAGGMDSTQLRKFYGKFGFTEIQQDPVILMSRPPQQTGVRRVQATYHNRGWSDGKGYPTEYSDKA